jgi:micrococcal nuclease
MNNLKLVLFIVAPFVAFLLLDHATVQERSGAWTLRETYTVKVVEIHDGDTVRVQFRNGIKDTVRMLGIDTPETSAGDTSPGEFDRPDTEEGRRNLARWGRRASRWLKSRIKPGDKVTLRFDNKSDIRGSYGRLLGYLVHDGTNLNAELIRHGLARVYPAPFSLRKQFNADQQQAKRSGSGVWGNDTTPREERTENNCADVRHVAVPTCGRDMIDCSDLNSYKQALRILCTCPGDPHNLDADGDGEPCESLR